MEAKMLFTTLQEADAFVTHITAAHSMLLAAIIRPLIESGSLDEADLRNSLDTTERAALERRTPETAALSGLVGLLRRDLGWS